MLINKKSRRTITTEKLREYKITHDLIAKWFRYSSKQSFNASSAKEDMIYGMTKLIEHVEYYLENKS